MKEWTKSFVIYVQDELVQQWKMVYQRHLKAVCLKYEKWRNTAKSGEIQRKVAKYSEKWRNIAKVVKYSEKWRNTLFAVFRHFSLYFVTFRCISPLFVF